jgi:hypothetical protein
MLLKTVTKTSLKSWIVLLCCLWSFKVYPQEKNNLTIGTGFGIPLYSWGHSGDLTTLRSINRGMWGINAYAQKEIKNNWVFEWNFTVHRFSSYLQIVDLNRGSKASTGYKYVFDQYQLNNLALRKFKIPNTKIAFLIGAGIGLNLLPHNSISVPENGFHFLRTKDNSGNSVPVYDISLIDSEVTINNKYSVNLISKLGLNYKISEVSSLVLFSHHGYNLAGPIMEKDLKEIMYENQNFGAVHKLSPWFSFISLGYEITLK